MSGTWRERTSPAGEPGTDAEQLVAAFARWRESLESVKKSIDGATAAVGLLRATLSEMEPLWGSLEKLEKALTTVHWGETLDEAAARAEEALAKSAGPQLEALAVPREEAAAPEAEAQDQEAPWRAARASGGDGHLADKLAGLTSDGGASYYYTVTVEDVGAKVKLVPLHQSLSRMSGVRELSLRSYTNGVAVVSVDSEVELEAEAIEEALGAGMNKACRVISGEGPSFIVRMGREVALGGQRRGGGVK
jgi:hypothetical protein